MKIDITGEMRAASYLYSSHETSSRPSRHVSAAPREEGLTLECSFLLIDTYNPSGVISEPSKPEVKKQESRNRRGEKWNF